jgi:glutathione S-transferase
MQLQLLWSARSPYARKVMIAAHERSIAHLVECIPAAVSMTVSSPEITGVNPLGQIPTLLAPDGTAIYDSLVICEYLDSLGSGAHLFPQTAGERLDALRRHALGQGMLDALTHWYSERRRLDDKMSASFRAAHVSKVNRVLDLLESTTEEWIGRPLDIGHVGLGCALEYLDFRQADPDWRGKRPRLATWLSLFAKRPSMTTTAFGAS